MGQLLSNLALGSRVKLNEDGQAKQFIVIGKDHYGSGTGVTLIREKTFAPIPYNSGHSLYNIYFGATLDNFCDGIWPLKLDPEVRDCIIPVPIVVAEGNGVATLHTIYRKAFALSCKEVGVSGWQTEGEQFSYFSGDDKRIAYLDDTTKAVSWGLRSPYSDNYAAYRIENKGSRATSDAYNNSFAPRPAFNLKSTVVVSSVKDSDDCYAIEIVPAKGGGVYVKNGGVWVKAV